MSETSLYTYTIPWTLWEPWKPWAPRSVPIHCVVETVIADGIGVHRDLLYVRSHILWLGQNIMSYRRGIRSCAVRPARSTFFPSYDRDQSNAPHSHVLGLSMTTYDQLVSVHRLTAASRKRRGFLDPTRILHCDSTEHTMNL